MCAIAGLVGSGAEHRRSDLLSMLNFQRHRGPDDEGTYFETGIALGHRRLSILDLSPAGRNPMGSADGRYQIVFNGEIFNYREIRSAVGSRYPFRTQTDTEVILAAYSLWGAKCLDSFEGMYAIAIWDRKERQLFLARDPFGIKPLYFAADGEGLRFASEIKPLLTGRKPEPEYQTIYRYLRWGQYDHARETFFKDVFRLLPGERAIWENGKLGFHEGPGSFLLTDSSRATSSLKDRLYHAVEIAVRSDVPIGVNLSGGLDSSLLAGLVNHMSGDMITLEGFLQDYDDPIYSERPWASEIASATGRHLNVSVLTAQGFLRNAEALLWHEEEPYGGVPVSGYLGLYQQAHDRNVVVLLDGNGLDECFAGYRSHHRAFLHDLHTANDPELPYFLKHYCQEWCITDSVASRELQHLSQDGLSRDGTSETYAEWLESAFLRDHHEPRFEPPRPYASALKNMMFQDLFFTKVPRALRFNDRVSMAFSKELRVPFLSLELARIGFSLPDKALFESGRPKGALRAAASGIIPEMIRNAPKRSVQTPQTAWLQGALLGWVRDTLSSSSFVTRGIFNPERVRARLDDVGSAPMSNSFSLWQALNLEQWFKQFIDSAVPQTAPRFDI